MLGLGIYRVLINDRYKLTFLKFTKGLFRFSSCKSYFYVSSSLS